MLCLIIMDIKCLKTFMTWIVKMGGEQIGLTTYDALGILHDDIEKLLESHPPLKTDKWELIKEILLHDNQLSTFSWISAVAVFVIGFCLIITSFFTNPALYGNLVGNGIFTICVGILNILLVAWDNQLRHNEIPFKIRSLLRFVKECQEKCVWKSENYPHLCSPYSPCITLQWTYRDGCLVNLPWALLCRGDVIVLRPGQPCPANCMQYDNQGSFLCSGDIYSPSQRRNHITMPTARVPFGNKRFILLETPLLRNIREVLESTSKKNVTCYDKQRHLIVVSCLQYFAMPLLVLITILVNIPHYIYISEWIGRSHWTVMFLLMPASVALPLLPLCFPAAWIALNTLGNAKLSAFLQSALPNKGEMEHSGAADPFEDISIGELDEEVGTPVKWGQHFLHSLLGQQHSLALVRSANPLHILGSVTALCCVDKKGILSWPNPTAEKIFFLKTSSNKQEIPRNETAENVEEIEELEEDPVPSAETSSGKNNKQPREQCTRIEVLDLTHDLSCPFKLQFDDTRWQQHMGSLKPIGLGILLNTCNMDTQEHYVQFCSHVTCEALYNEDLVPVTNRSLSKRCLCELPKQIGFADSVKNSYKLLEQLSTFRHVQPETVRRDIKFTRSLAMATKLKLPFPHMVAVVINEVNAPNSMQLFSQATGDIALDSCVDFWDGATLKTLTAFDRKKILDFYQRTSLTAYCTAFAYRPLGRSVSSKLSKVYMELPADSQVLYARNRSPTPLDWDLHQSTDSLFGMEGTEGEVSDIESCFEMQCNQIFLGMVTMQYQAQIEMVQLIEQLERACIRFVHFSKENELRSRVFSEKMGLESGWNCHISLLSSSDSSNGEKNDNAEGDKQAANVTMNEEDLTQTTNATSPLLGNNLCGSLEGSRMMSASAPCAINTEIVKESTDNTRQGKAEEDSAEACSQHGWQSLSCLTDSTEQSAPINFDMSNRAKLPRGIEQIRPHLEKVDNVPLLVSLFTDCTPSTTQQMIGIMQEYGEIVCVMGSSANADNSSIFLKANASVSVEPLYPQVCQKVPVFSPPTDIVSPMQLSQRLNSLPCSVAVTRQRPVSLYHLIMHARHYMKCLWNCVQFWMCGVFTISILQVIAAIVMLPPIFTTGQILWLSCVVVPFLALSLVHIPANTQVMQRPGSKSQSNVNSEVAIFVLWCYGCKFVPTLLLVPLVYGAILASHCHSVQTILPNGNCSLIYPMSGEEWGGWGVHIMPLSSAQLFASTLLALHMVMVSISFVHREYLSWRRSPFRNKTWLYTCIVILLLQSIYTLMAVLMARNSDYELETPWIAIVLAAVSPPFIFLINEFIKWQEIKANLRYEKRARLDFGTKLGMNSPF
ncbi:transmembrane protein 94-like protein l(2)k05819 isoform X2 [Rhodnius prolixus]|uniref:transmembrane protein 94-like protein l(2)k05819 isoform X2 n=1 Tax=Rhodnius prolixus TaxID=13249 RepID=UPI003D18D798